jgi:chromosome condensin MukBEF complex kleisin-like MukF subunit
LQNKEEIHRLLRKQWEWAMSSHQKESKKIGFLMMELQDIKNNKGTMTL